MHEHAKDDKRANLYACVACCTILPFIAVILRFWARRRVHAPFKADDYIVLVALVPLMGMNVCTILATYGGMGRHIIFAKSLAMFAKGFIVAEVCYACTITLTKLSVLFLYRRLFPSRQLKIISIMIAVLVLGYSLALVIVALVQCIPLSKTWNPIEHGICIDTKPAYTTTAVMNVLTDIFILSLPVKIVWRLQMKTTRKVQVIGLFLLGGVVCIFGIIRSVAVGVASNYDQTWSGVQGSIWSEVEMATATISACLPTLRPLFMKRTADSHTEYIHKDFAVTVTSGRRPTGGVELSERAATYKVWAGTKMPSHSENLDERPFVKLEAQEGVEL